MRSLIQQSKEKRAELHTLFQFPVELIVTNLKAWTKIFDRVTESVDELVNTIREVQPDKINDDKVKRRRYRR